VPDAPHGLSHTRAIRVTCECAGEPLVSKPLMRVPFRCADQVIIASVNANTPTRSVVSGYFRQRGNRGVTTAKLFSYEGMTDVAALSPVGNMRDAGFP
jgi:hypothetical protein